MTDQLRSYAQFLMKSHQYENAIFYVELLMTKNQDYPEDLLLFSEALYHNKEFRRVINFIQKKGLEKKYLTFRLLAAQSCVAIKDFIQALNFLELSSPNSNLTKNSLNASAPSFAEVAVETWTYDQTESTLFGRSIKELHSNCYLLLGEIFEHIENREKSASFYQKAVKADVKNFNAVRKLCQGNMLTGDEARSFIYNLDYENCPDASWGLMLRAAYEDMFHLSKSDQVVAFHPVLKRLNEATRLYNASRFKKCYQITSRIISEEPHNVDCFILHSAVLKELKKDNELFVFASSLVERYPDRRETWYALGCYYLSVGRPGLARKQFLRATEIDKFFGYAWLGVGHSYSLENERDQALAAYCSASNAIGESHIPILYIAVEYSLSKSMSVSLKYLDEAMHIGSSDPYCWHEKGFILFSNKNYQEALTCFLHAHDLHRGDSQPIARYWEPLFNNIGHCFYKLGELDKALLFFDRALGMDPKNPSTMSAIALVLTRKGDFNAAKSYLNNVLGLNRDILFASSLLQVITSLNYKYPRKQIEAVPLDDLLRQPQLLTKEATVVRGDLRSMHDRENVHTNSDEEMDLN